MTGSSFQFPARAIVKVESTPCTSSLKHSNHDQSGDVCKVREKHLAPLQQVSPLPCVNHPRRVQVLSFSFRVAFRKHSLMVTAEKATKRNVITRIVKGRPGEAHSRHYRVEGTFAYMLEGFTPARPHLQDSVVPSRRLQMHEVYWSLLFRWCSHASAISRIAARLLGQSEPPFRLLCFSGRDKQSSFLR